MTKYKATESNFFHYRTIPSRCPGWWRYSYSFTSIINRPPPTKSDRWRRLWCKRFYNRPHHITSSSTRSIQPQPRFIYHVVICLSILDWRVVTCWWLSKKCAQNFRYESQLAENSWRRRRRQPWDPPPPTN